MTTKNVLSRFSLDTLRDLPDIEALEDAGLLDKARFVEGGFPLPSGSDDDAAADRDDN